MRAGLVGLSLLAVATASHAEERSVCGLGTDEFGLTRLTMVDRIAPSSSVVTLILDRQGNPIAFVRWGAEGGLDNATLVMPTLRIDDAETLSLYLERFRSPLVDP